MSEDEIPQKRIRAPISVIMGHVDSGKTSLLDKVRKTAVQSREAGGITQHIGASLFPKETIFEISKNIHKGKLDLKIPGILIIDTPGHEAFMTLRSRGASVADIAIVVVDLTKGFQAQTFESIETLKRRKVPFVIAANKVDRIGGWKGSQDNPFVESYKIQDSPVKLRLDNLLYEIMGELSQLGINADRYDKIKDFRKTVAIIPTSATTGEGITDLFMVIAGLTQQYMMKKLTYADGPGKGVILEVKEEVGMGTTIDVILFDGSISYKDTIVLSGRKGPITTKIKSLLQPKPLDEMRDPRDRFETPPTIWAASGLKISAQNLEKAIAGGAIYVANNKSSIKNAEDLISQELSNLQISTSKEGILVRTDTLGSLEALISLMKEKGILIRSADVGDVSRRDTIDVSIIAQNNPEYGGILAFNVKIKDDAQELADIEGIEIFQDPIIYRLIDKFIEWSGDIKRKNEAESLSDLPRPTKIEHLPEFVFKRNKPMVIGIKVIAGELRQKDVLINRKNERLGTIHQIKLQNEFITRAKKDQEVSIAVRGPTFGRQVKSGQSLYVDLRAKNAMTLMTKYIQELPEGEKVVLSEMEKFKKAAGFKFWPFAE